MEKIEFLTVLGGTAAEIEEAELCIRTCSHYLRALELARLSHGTPQPCRYSENRTVLKGDQQIKSLILPCALEVKYDPFSSPEISVSSRCFKK
jgi:hypothetical protein